MSLALPIQDPAWIFFLVLLVILFAPLILNRLRIPHIIGMIFAGVVIGEHGLNLLARDASFEIFGKVGMYYIMFLAGLEMDMEGLRQNISKGITFGLMTSVIPFAFGFGAGYFLLNYSLSASLLLACIFASHTLVSFQLVSRYGLQHHPAVVISVAATLIALLGSLLILAVIAGHYRGGEGVTFWLLFLAKCLIYFTIVFFLFPRIIRWFFRHNRDRVIQYIFVITMVFFSAILADFCGIEGLVGAFVAGLVFNRFIPRTIPLMNRIEFVGNALFIPYFLVGVGMMVNLKPLFSEVGAIVVTLVIVLVSTLSKLLASDLTRRMFGFSSSRGLMMFGLTEAHAAGAIAMVMVGTSIQVDGEPLMSNEILDGVVIMILVSCIISSIATGSSARRLKLEEVNNLPDHKHGDDEKILIPINNPDTIDNLVHTAIMMRNPKLNRGIICLNVVNDSIYSTKLAKQSKEYLARASEICASADVRIQTQSRLAVNTVNGVVHCLRENDASEIIVGMHNQQDGDHTLLGSFSQGLLQGMARQLIIARYNIPVTSVRKVHVVIPERAEFETGFYRWVERLSRLVVQIGSKVTYYASDETAELIRQHNSKYYPNIRQEFSALISQKTDAVLKENIKADHLLVVVASRPGCVSYHKSMALLPRYLNDNFSSCCLMMIYPDQYEDNSDDTPSFLAPIK